MLGREPRSNFAVRVRRSQTSAPAVIENPSHLDDGTPMPTTFWLCDPWLRKVVSTLESEFGVRNLETCIDPVKLEESHRRYEKRRELSRPVGETQRNTTLVSGGHSPSLPEATGGVGGTARGLKCLHAHLAWWLVEGSDPAGQWAAAQLTRRWRDEIPQLCALNDDGSFEVISWPTVSVTDSDAVEMSSQVAKRQ